MRNSIHLIRDSIALGRERSRQALLVFLAASVAVHAAALVLVQPPAPDSAPPEASRLEVVIRQPTTVPVAMPTPAPAASASGERKSQSAPAGAERNQRPEQPLLAPAPTEPREDGRRSFPDLAEYQVPQRNIPEQKVPAAGATVTPAGFDAAYLSNPAPRYPPAARQAGEQGTVTVRVRVAVDGSASRVAVEKSSGSPHLDAAALEAVKAWRFTPARRGAEAVESWMLVPIVFRLEVSS